MRRVMFWVGIGFVLVMVVALPVLAQSDLAGLVRPMIVNVRQEIPVLADVVVDIGGGEVVTASVPLTVEVALQVSITGVVSESLVVGKSKPVIEVTQPDPQSVKPKEKSANGLENQFGIGETFTMGDLQVTVNGIEYAEGNQISKPDKGETFVVVDVSYENTGSESLNAPSLSIRLKDSTGQLHAIDFAAIMAAGGEMPTGEIAPGELIRGQYAFAVKEDAKGLTLAIDASIWDWGKYFVVLTE